MFVPHRLTLIVTNRCNARCAHCCMESSPDRPGRLSEAEIISAISQAAELGRIDTVVFAGGEPTMIGDALLEGISHAKSLGLNTRLVTNGVWGTSLEKARMKLVQLREVGLDELNVSFDQFHSPFIPPRNVENIWHSASGLGFRTVLIAVIVTERDPMLAHELAGRLGEPDNIISDREDPLNPEEWEHRREGTGFYIYRSKLQNLKRANSEVPLDSHSKPVAPEYLDGPCPFVGKNPAISPRNELLACCGFDVQETAHLNFGALDAAPMKALLTGAFNDIVPYAIATIGPYRLRNFIADRAPQIPFKQGYASVCEVCEDVVSRPEALRAIHEHSDDLTVEILRVPAERAKAVA